MSEQPGGYAGGTAQWVGILVFVGGVVLIALTFATAWHLFKEPSILMGPLLNPSPKQDPVHNLTVSGIVIFIKIAMLFAMMLAGSLVAARGIQLFGAGRGT